MTEQEIIERGRKAKRLLDNADFKELISEIQKDLFNQFQRTNVLNDKDREELHKVSYAVLLLEKKLEKYTQESDYEIGKIESEKEV